MRVPLSARSAAILAVSVWLFGAGGCGDGGSDGEGAPEPSYCLETAADATCTASLYGTDATFSDVFTRTLQPKCGSNPACHSGPNAQRGLSFDDESAAYDLLMMDSVSGARRLTPGDTQCGELVYRLELPGGDGMPPGSPLSEQELCSIRHWIANGAPR